MELEKEICGVNSLRCTCQVKGCHFFDKHDEIIFPKRLVPIYTKCRASFYLLVTEKLLTSSVAFSSMDISIKLFNSLTFFPLI